MPRASAACERGGSVTALPRRYAWAARLLVAAQLTVVEHEDASCRRGGRGVVVELRVEAPHEVAARGIAAGHAAARARDDQRAGRARTAHLAEALVPVPEHAARRCVV